jgi:multiple sugar transport system permease protein
MESWGEWFDRHSRTFFIAPAVTLILIFAIFPTFYSIVFALSRVRFTANGLQFRFVGLQNFAKQFTGTEQEHFLGKVQSAGVFGTIFFAAVTLAVLWWLYRSLKITSWVGMVGRLISAAMAIFVAWVLAASLLAGNPIGTLVTTLFYVFVGCALQFVIGTGLAFLCSQPISGKNFFRVIFFIPLMVTPLGVGYAMKMVADVTRGPFEPVLKVVVGRTEAKVREAAARLRPARRSARCSNLDRPRASGTDRACEARPSLFYSQPQNALESRVWTPFLATKRISRTS